VDFEAPILPYFESVSLLYQRDPQDGYNDWGDYVNERSALTFWDNLPCERLMIDASVWSADLARLADDFRRVEGFVDLYHFDVSDAHFVPGLLFFPDLVASLRPLTPRPFHVHLMAEDPLALIDDFAHAGADLITVHCDLGPAAAPAIRRIREVGVQAGLGFGLDAAPERVLPFLEQISLVLLMGTPMGVKGQGLSSLACPRIERMRALLEAHGMAGKIKIEADGGIRTDTAPALRTAGVDLLVPGSLLFKSKDLPGTAGWLRGLNS
jgi:ribulose-phosphate 3-epimerase